MARAHLILMCTALLVAAGCRPKQAAESGPGAREAPGKSAGDRAGPAAGKEGPGGGPEQGAPDEPVKTWERSGERPTFSMIKKAYKAEHGKRIRIHAKPQDLDDGRYFCLVSELSFEDEDDTDPLSENLFAMVVSENVGKAQIESRVELLVKKSDLALEEDPEFEPYAAYMYLSVDKSAIGDLDADGQPEALVETWYEVQERAHGLTFRRQYYILDLDPVAQVAFTVLTWVHTDESECEYLLSAHCKRKDVDGDGHPDVVVKVREESECMGLEEGTGHVTEYLWDEATDTWQEHETRPVKISPEPETDEEEDDGEQPVDKVSSADAVKARELGTEALALAEEGEHEKAVELFKAAYDLDPRPLILWDIAVCCHELGRNAEAVGYMEKFLEDLEQNGPPEAMGYVKDKIEQWSAETQDAAGSGDEEPQYTGKLSKWDIRDTLKAEMKAFEKCFGLIPEDAGKQEGVVSVEFVIGETGDVSSARVTDTTLGNVDVEHCILERIKKVKFPAPEGGKVLVEYPFLVRPGE